MFEDQVGNLIEAIAHAVSNRFARDGGFCGHEAAKEFAYDISKAIEDAGYRCVPVEPTEAMLKRGYAELCENDGASAITWSIYQAMLAAAPDVKGGDA